MTTIFDSIAWAADGFGVEGQLRVYPETVGDGTNTSRLVFFVKEGFSRAEKAVDLQEVRDLRDALTAFIDGGWKE